MLCSGALRIEAYSGQPGFKHALPDIFFFVVIKSDLANK